MKNILWPNIANESMPETIKKHTISSEPSNSFGLTSAQFRKVAPNGFGEAYNCYPHAMTWFNEHLYVGTTRANLHYRGRWRAEQKAENLGSIWPVKIPEGGLFDIDLRAQIWRYNLKTDEWKKVFTSPYVRGIDGYDVPLSIGFRSITSYKGTNDDGPALYIPTWGSHQTPESVMLRSKDGDTFEIVSEPGLGFPDPYQPRAVRAFYVFKDKLFASPTVGRKRAEPNFSGYTVIFVTDNPAGGQWELACTPCFGDPNNLTIFQVTQFNGYLYAGTGNLFDGFQIWKTAAEGRPPFKWLKVLDKGAYRGKYNQVAMSMVAFGDHLYIGTAIQEGGWDYSNKIGPAPPELIRIDKKDNWELVVGEARATPDGFKVPISGAGPGFGNPFAGYFWSICEHEGWLYLGDSEWSLFVKYAQEDKLPEKFKHMLRPKFIDRLLHDFGGFDLWKSRDGRTWSNVTRNGMNNFYNMGLRTMVSTKYGLFLGAANPFTPEIATKRASGWTYEHNPKGGLEIWLGSNDFDKGKPLDRINASFFKGTLCKKKQLTEKEIENEVKSIESFFFGNSNFRNYGFWNNDITGIAPACENLVQEMLSYYHRKEGLILDINCGRGTIAKYLASIFSANNIFGRSATRNDLKHCTKEDTKINFFYKLSTFGDHREDFFDLVLGLREINKPFPVQVLLADAYNLLRPGGKIVLFDYIETTRRNNSSFGAFFGKLKSMNSIKEYRETVENIGFSNVLITDITAHTLQGYRKYAARFFFERRLATDHDEQALQKAEKQLVRDHDTVKQCLLISATKEQVNG